MNNLYFDPAYGQDKSVIAGFDSETKEIFLIDPSKFGATTQEEIEGVIELLNLIQ